MSNEITLAQLLDRFDELPAARALRHWSYDLLRLQPGATVVDVGCGTGRAVAELAERGAKPVGVDVDGEMLDLAGQRWPAADFREAGGENLPFADGTLAGYRADKVYHALPDPAAAVAEARRVLAPDGRLVLLGQDWESLAVDSSHPALTRTILQARADTVASPRAARGFRALLLDAGFTDVTVEVPTGVLTDPSLVLPMLTGFASNVTSNGAVTEADAARWLADQERRARTDRLLVAVPVFVAAATRQEPRHG